MSKSLEALRRIKNDMIYQLQIKGECVVDNDFHTIEKELKAFEIIKKYPRCSLQRYIAFNELVEDGYELTQEHLFLQDMPCSVEEYNIVMKVLL